jgi:hypothetical protein
VRFHDLPEDFEITKPVEEWSNGLLVCEFKALDRIWDLKRSVGKRDEPFYTYLSLASHNGTIRTQPTPDWLEGYHIPTLPGTVDPETAAQILQMIATQWRRGEEAGRRHQQADFRKVIGIK